MTTRSGGIVAIETSSPANKTRRIWAFERGSLWTMNLIAGVVELFPTKPSIDAKFGEVRREDGKKIAEAMGLPDVNPVLHRLASGKRCYAAWINNEIAAYGWVSRSAECIGEIEHEIQLQPNEAYIWDCATLPRYRQKGLYIALLVFICSELHNEGLRQVWIGSSVKNKPSLRGFSRAGFLPVITLNYFRMLNLSVLWVTGDPDATRSSIASARHILTSNWKHLLGSFVFDFSSQGQISSISHSSCSDGTI